MVTLTIDGKTVTAQEGTTILEAARANGINIPSLCYLKNINQIAACRICVVEIKGISRLMPACDNQVAEGMEIYTNSPRVRQARKTNLQLILSQHDCRCAICIRSGNCTLQKLANDMNLLGTPYETELPIARWNQNLPLIRDAAKCVKCMRCVQICDKVQSLNIWDVAGTGSRTTVNVSKNRKLEDADCSYCAQCITHCPVGALHERDDTVKVLKALADPDIVTVVQVAPAVRAAWAEDFGLPLDVATPGRMVSALKALGFDYVYDTNFSADLTIMEEGSEFIERFTHRDQYPWPMFTSCCPGWVRFVKSQFPQFTANLSTAKSPQQMFGAVAKTYFAEKMGIPPEKLKVISVMPCVSKKSESDLPTMRGDSGEKDVDIVLTTRELARLLKSDHVDITKLPEQQFDFPLGTGTGAAVIFGATGGVMDAALRSAYFLVTGKNPDADAFLPVRGMNGWKEAAFDIPGAGTVRVAVAHGLANTRKLMEAIEAGKVAYDFVEIMACPGGCAGGGGQPIHDGLEMAALRGSVLWELDKGSKFRFSHENPEVHTLYEEYLEKPLSHKAHHLLHTDHFAWEMPRQR